MKLAAAIPACQSFRRRLPKLSSRVVSQLQQLQQLLSVFNGRQALQHTTQRSRSATSSTRLLVPDVKHAPNRPAASAIDALTPAKAAARQQRQAGT
eukprot:m.137870 g.137870  ORF g.137870 m.137870 type:complete len:96 (+) comp16613_c0_seq4:1391-1678(+)